MSIVLQSSGGGSITLQEPATASNHTLTLPNAAGTVALTSDITAPNLLTRGTAQNSTSGTNIDFTGIPSWAKRVTVMFREVSTTGTNSHLLQIGTSSGFQTTGYLSYANSFNSSPGGSTSASGYLLTSSLSASSVYSGAFSVCNISGNTWVMSGVLAATLTTLTPVISVFGGTVALSGTLDRLRFTTVGGTDTFDAGSINIMWE